MGKVHLKLITELSCFELAGIYDIDKALTKELADKYGIKACNSYEELLDTCEAVDIVTPTLTHHDIAAQAIRKGRHVFIEKPVTDNLADAKKLDALAQEARVKIQVGHVERFNPAFLAAMPYIENPMFIEIHRLAPFNVRGTDISVVLDLMIHDIDLTLSIVKSNIRHISATGAPVVCDTSDIANARIEFENGCVANITVNRIAFHPLRKLRLFQKNAYIHVDLQHKTTEIARMRLQQAGGKSHNVLIDKGFGPKQEVYLEHPIIQPINAIKFELESFYNCIVQKTQPIVSIHDAMKALDLSLKIDELVNAKALNR